MRVVDAEQRLRSAVTHSLLAGSALVDPAVLRYFGFEPDNRIVVLALAEVGPVLVAEKICQRVLGACDDPYLLCTEADTVAAVLPESAAASLDQICAAVRVRLQRRVSAGVSLPGRFADLPAAFAQARAAALGGDVAGQVTSFAQLRVFSILLDGRTRGELELIAQPLTDLVDREQTRVSGGSGLARTLTVFLGHNGHLEGAAAALGIHRHTLRNRIARIQSLLDRDLNNPDVRAEMWLAIKARELLDIRSIF